jgi:thioredoxin 1
MSESGLVILNSTNFAEEVLQFDGVVLVDFWAPWCGPCRVLGPEIEKLSLELKDNTRVKVCKLNTDENPDLAVRYQIMSIPNVILFKNGQKVGQSIGVRSKDDFKKMILEALLK